MSNYTPWLEPVTMNYDSLDWRRAHAFFKVFVRRIPERIAALEQYVGSTPGFENWRADCSERSLRELGPWLSIVLKRRKLGRDEKQFVPFSPALTAHDIEQLDDAVKDAPMWEFLPESEALLVDVGMYIGECVRRRFPTTKWIRCRGRGNVDYNTPLLAFGTNFGFAPLVQPSNKASHMLDRIHGADEAVFLRLFHHLCASAEKTEPRRAKWTAPKRL